MALIINNSVGLGGVNEQADVIAVKTRLIELGFDWLSPDETMGPITIKATVYQERFQLRQRPAQRWAHRSEWRDIEMDDCRECAALANDARWFQRAGVHQRRTDADQ